MLMIFLILQIRFLRTVQAYHSLTTGEQRNLGILYELPV